MIYRFVGAAALIAKAQHAVSQAIAESAEDLVSQAQERSPVDTGTLRAGIHVSELSAMQATVATGGESNEYAGYVHEGTSKMEGRPFMTEALLDNAPVYREAIQRAVHGAF